MNLFNLGGWFTNLWMDLWISLNSVVYQLIEWLYEIFEAIANVNLFSKDAFNDITSRLYVVIGIAMLFIFAYNIILMIINPDDKKSIGNTSKIVKETVIAFVLIILLPTIFNYMAIFQKNVLDSHILEQIILGDTAGTTVDCDFSELELINSYVNVKNGSATQDMQNHCNNYKNLTASQRGAYLVAPTMFTAFFHPTNYGYDECVNYLTECKGQGTSCNSSDGLIATDDDKELCAYYVYDSNIAQFKGGIANFVTDDGVYSSAWSDKGIFDFNYLIAFAAGILGVWMFICYAMAIGVRVAKLGFFQIISPIPVMLRIIPKQKEAFYDKWFKHLVDAYLDVFIRLAIIYFCLFAISLVPDVMDSLFASLTGNIFTKALATVIVILGILKFAQECPDLLKEFFGSSGKFALKSPSKQLSENKYGSAALGMAGGGLSTLAGNIWNARKNFKEADGAKNKAKALLKAPFSAAGGTIGGAARGMMRGYGASGFKDLGRRIAEAKEATDIAQAEGIVERMKHRANRIGEGFVDFGQFIAGTSASNILGSAANTIMVDVDNMENEFSNATIAGIKEGRSEIMKKFNADQEFDFAGKHYRKVDGDHWSDGTKHDIKHGDLGKEIADSYKDRLAKAYADNESKSGIIDGFKRANESMLKDLRNSMPKFGEEFSKTLFKNLNNLTNADGIPMNLNVRSLDDLEDRMKKMLDANQTPEDLKKGLASIYKINDEIKSLAKGVKISNDQAVKAQAARNDKKDKK